MTSQGNTQKKDENFWTLDEGYMKTVKRTEDGRKMVNFLERMIEERAAVEKNYAVRLNKWYLRWLKKVEKSSEYGTTKEMLKKSLTEADRMSDIHTSVRDTLTNLTNAKAQKPWKVQSKKLELLQKELNNKAVEANNLLAIRPEPQGYNQWKENCDLLLRQVDNSKERLAVAENELSALKETYVADMNNVFASAQEFETRRLEFFKEILGKFHDALKSCKDNVNDVYSVCMDSISKSNPRSDVGTWSSAHGPAAAVLQFSSKGANSQLMTSLDERRKVLATSSVVVPVVTKAPSEAVTANVTAVTAAAAGGGAGGGGGGMNKGFMKETTQQRQYSHDFESEFDLDSVDLNNEAISKNSTLEVRPVTTKPSTSASGLHDYDSPLYSTLNEEGIGVGGGVAGEVTRVKALYDYEGKEDDDELTFKKGDTFDMLRGKDANGWATGRKAGRVGLFPESYVKVLD